MPTLLPPGLVLGAIPKRGDIRDCVLTRAGDENEPQIVGTASLRRMCLSQRCPWRTEPIRDNVLIA